MQQNRGWKWEFSTGGGRSAKDLEGVFVDLYNINTQEYVAVHICDFDGIRRDKGEPIGRAEIEVRMSKLTFGKAAGKDEITEEKIEGGGDRVVDLIWRRCNMAFESCIVPEDWRSVVIVPLYKGKGERTECSNYRGISLFSLDEKIYAGISVDRARRVTGGLINDD